MKRLLRSVIDFDGAITREQLVSNMQRLSLSKLEWTRPDDARVYAYVEGYFRQYLELPSGQTVRDYFEDIRDVETVERIKDIAAAPWYVRTNFAHLLGEQLEHQRRTLARALLKQCESAISSPSGIEFKDAITGKPRTLAGVDDSLDYLQQRLPELRMAGKPRKTEGDIRDDAQAMVDEYATAERDKSKAYGALCGIDEIDSATRGIKRGELWIHAGYAGELKSAFCLNWAYNLATHYKRNVVYCTLEMRYEHIRRIGYAMHTSNPKWAAEGIKPLDYRKIRDGELTPEEREFYYSRVIPDFNGNAEYTHFHVWAPPKAPTLNEIWTHAEGLHRQFDVGVIVIDYSALVATEGRYRDYVVDFNSVVREAHQMAVGFDGGEGVAVLMPFQINRKGKEEAMKNGGVYNMSALSYSNEAERSADVVTTSYLDDSLRASGRTKICNLKNRDNDLFPPFLARVDFMTRRIYGAPASPAPNSGMEVEDYDLV